MLKLGLGNEMKDINQRVFQQGKSDANVSMNGPRGSVYGRGGSKKVNFANLASDNLL